MEAIWLPPWRLTHPRALFRSLQEEGFCARIERLFDRWMKRIEKDGDLVEQNLSMVLYYVYYVDGGDTLTNKRYKTNAYINSYC